MSNALVVNEIYQTISGEGTTMGLPCTIIRLTGCNLRCKWCDTTYAYFEGKRYCVDEIISQVNAAGLELVLVTGGEPLIQSATPMLLEKLCDAGYKVLLETNGSRDISDLPERVIICMDVKCPGSGQADSLRWENFDYIKSQDEVKFVLTDRNDYEYARKIIQDANLIERCNVIFSPAWAVHQSHKRWLIEPGEIVKWILADNLNVRLSLQIHKIIWPDKRGGI